ncbi:MAG: hypothetical protein GQ559_01675 [Desulfobulbaceae bacterium]|nr:hypothetical protein [Desulfobulbaceae bacterium]
MMMKLSRYITRIGLELSAVVVLITALGGCGFKSQPVPPQEVVPQAITDLRYQLSEKGVTLFWSYPIETVTGSDIVEISSFKMYRAVVPEDSYCESCPIPFGWPITLSGGALPDEGKKTATYETTLLRPGNLYFFKVRGKSGWLAESADSNVVSFLWNIPPRAPEGLTAEAGDGRINLNWQPVSRHLDGTEAREPVQYQVERSLGGGAFTAIGKLVSGTEYTDIQVQNGRKYFYRIQAVGVHEQGTVGGGFSEAAGATPVDRTAPAPPTNVKGVKTAGGVKVFWEPNKEKDLKGYRVYRRLPGDDAPTLVGNVDAPYTLFEDKTPPADAARLFYSVSSIDTHSPGNESAGSPEVMIRK